MCLSIALLQLQCFQVADDDVAFILGRNVRNNTRLKIERLANVNQPPATSLTSQLFLSSCQLQSLSHSFI
jgi:hypothetical protein